MMSILFAIRAIIHSESTTRRTCCSQYCKLTNDLRLVMSQTRTTPRAPRQQCLVMLLNFSLPAVSHNQRFTFLPSFKVTNLLANSTPTVGGMSWNWPVRKCYKICDLPALQSPVITILNKNSYYGYVGATSMTSSMHGNFSESALQKTRLSFGGQDSWTERRQVSEFDSLSISLN